MAKLIEITGKALSGEWGTEDETGDGIPVLRTTNFTNEGVINYQNIVTRTIRKKNIADKYLRYGDIIIEKSGGSDKQPVGRVIFFDGPENTYLFNNFTGLLRVQNQECWLPKYVFYSLFGNYRRGGTRPFENKTTGLHNLKIDDFVSRFEVTEVDYKKQVDICEQLDRLYNVIKLREEELSRLDELIKARFVEMFGDPNSDDEKWQIKPFKDVTVCFDSSRKPIKDADRQKIKGPYPYYGAVGIVDYLNDYKLDGTYLLISEDGKALEFRNRDIAFIASGKIWVNNHAHVFQCCADINMLYLKQYMLLLDITPWVTGIDQKKLNRDNLNTIPVPVPPLSLQKEYAAFVSQVDKSKVAVQKALDETQLLFNSLMQEYFG